MGEGFTLASTAEASDNIILPFTNCPHDTERFIQTYTNFNNDHN